MPEKNAATPKLNDAMSTSRYSAFLHTGLRRLKSGISLPAALGLGLLMLFSSCDKNRIYEENKEIKDYVWDVKDAKNFDVEVTDSVTPNNFYINVRNADSYPYSNLYLFIKTTFPNGKFSHDTLECILASPEGKWLGKGLGDIWDNQIPFKKSKRFPLKGKYTFSLEQGMRVPKLPQIMDVGIRIEKAGR